MKRAASEKLIKVFSKIEIKDIQIWMTEDMKINVDQLSQHAKMPFGEFTLTRDFSNFLRLLSKTPEEILDIKSDGDFYACPELTLYFASLHCEPAVFLKLMQWLFQF